MTTSLTAEEVFNLHPGDRLLANEERTVDEPIVNTQEMLTKIRAEQQDEALLSAIEFSYTSTLEKKNFGSYVYYVDKRIENKIWTHDTNGLFIELWDGSEWAIDPYYRHIACNWLLSDRLYIVPADTAHYQFKLVNMEDGSTVFARMTANPIANGVYTRKIERVDRFFGRIILNDGTICNVDSWDYSRLDYWIRDDTVLIGVNNWGSVVYPYAIINANVNTPRGKSVVYVNFVN